MCQEPEEGRMAVIYLDCEITDEYKSQFLLVLDQMLNDNIDIIRIVIDSGGGSIDTALAMYDRLNRLKRCGIEIETEVEGTAASSAIIILLAGDKRSITQYSRIMTHLPQLHTKKGSLDEDEIEEILIQLKKVKKLIAGIISKRTGMYLTEVLRDMKSCRVYNAEEALDAGLVHEVI